LKEQPGRNDQATRIRIARERNCITVNSHGLLKTSLISVALLLSGHAANGAEVDLRTSTYLHFYQVDQVLGSDTDHAPLYQYLSLDVREANNSDLSFHLYGWGRLDLQDETNPDMSQGHFSSAHARYRHRDGQGQFRAGRIFITEGTAMEAMDGFYLKESFDGFGVALFGGVPNGDEDAQFERGDILAGTRVWAAIPGRIEAGLNYLHEDGNFEGDKRQEAGMDLWLQPTGGTFVTSKLLYNLSTSDLAYGDLTLFFQPAENVDLSFTGASYSYHDLFQSAVNPAFGDSALDPSDEVTTISGSVEWRSSQLLTLLGSAKLVNHKLDDPGEVMRTEAGFDLAPDGDVSIAGLRLATQSGDLAENEYNDLRGFSTFSVGRLAFALDAIITAYEEQIDGEDQALQVTGSAGWQITPTLKVSTDLRLKRSPVYDEDVSAVLRLDYGHGVGSGVYK
jgi:hypothetical protein